MIRQPLMSFGIGVWVMLGTLGCQSAPAGPSAEQEWISLEEYARRTASGVPPQKPLPVVIIPEGAELHLNVFQKTGWPPLENLTPEIRPFFERYYEHQAFEPVEDTVVKSRARCRLYLDLENVQMSTDKEIWYLLEFSFFPAPTASRLSLLSKSQPAVAVPVETLIHFVVVPSQAGLTPK